MGTLSIGQKVQSMVAEPVIVEVEKIVEKVVEIPVEVIVEKTVEIPVEKIVEVPVEVVKEVEVIREVIKEVPKIVYVDKIVTVEDSSKIKELCSKIRDLEAKPPVVLTPKWVYPVLSLLGVVIVAIILIK